MWHAQEGQQVQNLNASPLVEKCGIVRSLRELFIATTAMLVGKWGLWTHFEQLYRWFIQVKLGSYCLSDVWNEDFFKLTDDDVGRRQVTVKAHITLSVRWAKNVKKIKNGINSEMCKYSINLNLIHRVRILLHDW